ncbi:MAG: hypothetical protein EZS28_005270, partial [Streblomastix strix]
DAVKVNAYADNFVMFVNEYRTKKRLQQQNKSVPTTKRSALDLIWDLTL